MIAVGAGGHGRLPGGLRRGEANARRPAAHGEQARVDAVLGRAPARWRTTASTSSAKCSAPATAAGTTTTSASSAARALPATADEGAAVDVHVPKGRRSPSRPARAPGPEHERAHGPRTGRRWAARSTVYGRGGRGRRGGEGVREQAYRLEQQQAPARGEREGRGEEGDGVGRNQLRKGVDERTWSCLLAGRH